jgi:hypothetical protein
VKCLVGIFLSLLLFRRRHLPKSATAYLPSWVKVVSLQHNLSSRRVPGLSPLHIYHRTGLDCPGGRILGPSCGWTKGTPLNNNLVCKSDYCKGNGKVFRDMKKPSGKK